jgi:putative ABC transport system substrate-binding protein
MQMFAKELVELRPDVIVTHTTPVTSALHRQTRTIPMVFVNVSDPVGAGFVAGLPHPGGNITGFSNLEASMGGKWVELLIEIAPAVKRAGLIFNPDNGQTPASYYLPSFEAAARSLKVAPISAPVHTDADIEAVITELGHEPQGGLVVMADGGFNSIHRVSIISLAARNHVPAVYFSNYFAKDGGLLSYGVDNADMFRRAASYVDRILHGAKPTDLPVQLPVKFEMAVNVKTAQALSLTVPQTLLLAADEVIQ